MNVIHVFRKAAAAAGRRRGMIFWLWTADLLFALAAVMPLYLLTDSDYGHSLAGENSGRINLINLADFTYRHQDLGPAMAAALAGTVLIFLVLSTFLNGGIIGRIAADERKTEFRAFSADCGKYFPRFFRVFLLSLPVYFIVLGPFFRLASAPLDAWIRSAPAEWPAIIASVLKGLLALLLLSLIQMTLGYVKIDLVITDRKDLSGAVVTALAFLGRRFFKAWGLYLFIGVLGLAAGGIFLALTGFLPQSGVTTPWAGLILAQLFIAARVGIKILFFAGEFHLYQADLRGESASRFPLPTPASLPDSLSPGKIEFVSSSLDSMEPDTWPARAGEPPGSKRCGSEQRPDLLSKPPHVKGLP